MIRAFRAAGRQLAARRLFPFLPYRTLPDVIGSRTD